MPIIPQHQTDYGDIPTRPQNAPGIEAYPGYNESIQATKISAAGMNVAEAGSQAWARQRVLAEREKRVAETTEVANRVMDGMNGMSEDFDTLKDTPTQHTTAPAVWSQAAQERMKTATDGLRPDLATKVQREMMRTQLEYSHHARGLQRTANIDDAKATMDRGHDEYVENGSRLDRTDANAFEAIDSRRGAVAGALTGNPGEVTGGGVATDPTVREQTPLGSYEALVTSYVTDGLISKVEGRQRLDKVRRDTALGRANTMAITTPNSLVKLAEQEEAKKDSTYLGLLDPVTRARVVESAQNRIKSLKHEEFATQDRERQALDRENHEMRERTDVMAAQKLSDPKQYGKLDMPWLDLAAELRLMSPAKYEHYKSQIQTQEVQGGTVDPLVTRRFQTELYHPPKSYASTQADLMANRSKLDPTFYQQAMNGLEEKVKAERAGRLDPEIKAKTTAAKELARVSLRATSPFEKLEPTQAVEVSGLMRALDDNQFSANPRDPRDVLAEYLPGAQSRVMLGGETIATGVSKSQRQVLNLPPRKPKEDVSVAETTLKLVQEYQSLPPASTRRAQIKTQLQMLKELSAVEKAIDDAADYKKRNGIRDPIDTTTTDTTGKPIKGRRG